MKTLEQFEVDLSQYREIADEEKPSRHSHIEEDFKFIFIAMLLIEILREVRDR